jgi:hypothetical protein
VHLLLLRIAAGWRRRLLLLLRIAAGWRRRLLLLLLLLVLHPLWC